MTFFSLALLVLGTFVSFAHAAPSRLFERASVTPLSGAQISAFKPFTFFASAAYCQPSATLAWNCGANCQANADFQPVASRGNGVTVQFFSTPWSLPNKERIRPKWLNSAVQVHNGFRDNQASTAPGILAAVQQSLAAHSGATVTMVGHSLGAALTLLDSIFLSVHLPVGTQFKTVGYGMPRVGNKAFADFVDAHSTQLTRITNKHDPVPIVPGRFLGFQHPSGEVHIDQQTSAFEACSGQENTSDLCTVGDEPNLFVANIKDHFGPYDGVTVGC
ncbi:lipase class 3 family protein [Rickenella mellea]|uniref:Lipase class 3 family protein n=1 Tax=Rickenella mellea TaxID=50990 RepID=A0A4Y7QEG5_9AGAM|nr:lipase class 3 family protein [Rickenella mellea]